MNPFQRLQLSHFSVASDIYLVSSLDQGALEEVLNRHIVFYKQQSHTGFPPGRNIDPNIVFLELSIFWRLWSQFAGWRTGWTGDVLSGKRPLKSDGAGGGSRTHTALRPTDFESAYNLPEVIS